MPAKVSADQALEVSTGIAKVWKANPAMTLGKSPEKVELTNFQASIKTVEDLNEEIEELRHQLSGLIDDRDDAALTLSAYNTRALSAIRGIFGPDSTEYDQAGGICTSERKRPVRTKALVVK